MYKMYLSRLYKGYEKVEKFHKKNIIAYAQIIENKSLDYIIYIIACE